MDVRVLAGESSLERIDQLRQLPMPTTRGTTIQLGQIATIEERAGTPQINRRDRARLILVSSDAAGRPSGDVSADIQESLKALSVPAGYSVKLAGQSAEQQSSFASLFQALGLSILLTYMVTVALYESLVTPFVVLLSLPLAAVGAIWGLAITGSTLNLLSLIGFILLTGLVGKNAILLLDYTVTLRKQGLPRDEALMAAGPIRLRPILMTATALIIALLPVALGTGEGAEICRPIAIPVIGGMISSTLLTLVFIPAFYTVVDDLQLWVRRLFRRQPRIVVEEGAPAGDGRVVAVRASDGEGSAEEVAGRR